MTNWPWRSLLDQAGVFQNRKMPGDGRRRSSAKRFGQFCVVVSSASER